MSKPLANLAELLRARAANEPERRAYLFLADGETETASLTWAGLDRRARAIAAALTEAGARGERVLLLHPPGLEFVAAFFGCLYAGAVAVPSQPPHRQKEQPRLRAIAGDARPRVVLCDSTLAARREEIAARIPELAGAAWIDTGRIGDDLADRWEEIPLAPDAPAFLQYTSGSTSTPKGVVVTHANLLHNEEMIRRAFGQSAESVIVGWLPLYHDMGLIGNVLQPLYAGATCVLMPPVAFLQRPARWLRAIGRYRATTSGGPSFAYDLCVRKVGPEERADLDLSSWNVAFNGAEPVRAETLERFAAAFAPSGFRREAFYPCYGLAEATLFVTGGAPGAGPVVRAVDAGALALDRVEPPREGASWRELVGCGRPWLGQEVVIADPETGAPLPDGRVGEVLVAGPSVAAGYWGQPEETARTFRAGPDGRFLRTGDLGFLNGGELFLTGRIKELIILRGRNLYPHDVERTAEASHPALHGGVGAAFSVEMEGEERLVLVHEVARTWRGEVTEVAGAVRQAVALEHETRVEDLVLVRVGSIERTSSGKIRRRASREAYLAGGLMVVAREARDEEEQDASLTEWSALLAEEASRALRRQAVDPDAPLIAQGLDSLAAAELQSAVEARTGVALSMTALLEGASLRTLEAEAPEWEAFPVRTAEPDAPGEHPASEGQRALWFLDRLSPGAAALHLAGAARVREGLDIEALRRAADLLVRRHPALRTTFEERDGEPVRRVHEWLAPDVREGSLDEAFLPFDLERGPLMRLRVAEGGTALLVVVHHLIADYASVAVLLRDLAALYRQKDLPPPGPGYTVWLRRREEALAGPRGEELREWWRERLSGELPVLDLPVDRPPGPERSRRGVIRTARLDGSAGALRDVGRRRGSTLYAALLAGLQAVLHRWTGQDEALVAAPAAGRGAGYEREIGYFVNPVVLRLVLPGDPSFEDLVAVAGRTALEAFEHGAWPFARLVRDLRVPPLQAMFVLQPARTPEERALAAFALGEAGTRAEVAGLEMESLALPEARVQSDLTLMAAEVGKDGKDTKDTRDGKDGILLSLQLDADLFDAVTAERLLGHLTNLLAAGAADPGRRVSEIEILSAAEREQIAGWSAGPPLPAAVSLLSERIAAQAARSPGAVALIHNGERLTYQDLWHRVSGLADRLRRLGVGPETRVGICAARTPDMVAAMLAVLEAGGAYVPLDPAYPAERLALLLEDSGAALALADVLGEERLPSSNLPVIRLGEEADHRPVPGVRPNPENLAWLIYTSGSTGRPKAVGITHRSAAALADWAETAFPDMDGVLASTSIGFDLSIFEILLPLSRGGRVVLAGSALDLPEIPASAGVRLVNTVPSAMSELLRAGALPASLETVNLAGEPLRRELARALFAAGVRRVMNLYGPSEDTTYSTVADLAPEDEGEPPIGRPVAGTTARVLDAGMRPVPRGVSGELFLGGAGLARGYLGRPDLTAERFVPSPFPEDGPGARLYSTGDRVRWRPDGQLAFLGRLDHQVKVRGFRIELGEVEAALAACPGVEQAVVLALGEGAERRLVGFMVGRGTPGTAGVPPAQLTKNKVSLPAGRRRSQGGSPLEGDLRSDLGSRLPAHMIPSAFVFLDALPLTPNGKVDRKALAAMAAERSPERSGGGAVHEPPRTPVERRLAAIWSELLGVREVGVRDDFFALGGHSLLLTRLLSRMREAFGVELKIGQVFAAPTIAGQAALLEAADAVAGAEPILPVPRTEPIPLSPGQERLWFIDQLEGGGAAYNMPAAVRLSGPLDRAALVRALNRIVERHEALRTSLPAVDGRPVQAIAPLLALAPTLVDLSALADPETEAARLSLAEARAPFDLARGPLLRAALLRLGAEEHRLLLTLHHAVADGWSLGVFLDELSRGYGASEPLPPLPIQCADWTIWQRRRLEGGELDGQIAWWRDHLAGAPPRLEIPADRPRPSVQSFRGGQLRRVLPNVAGLGDATLFMTLFAAFAALLHRITGEEDLVIGSPVANRNRRELEGVIGFFVNVLPLRAVVDGGRSFGDLVAGLRPAILGAFDHQEVPFERLVAELRPERIPGEPPLTQVLFTLQNASMPAPRLEGLEVTAGGVYNGTAKLDLAMEVTATDEGLKMALQYSSDLFDAGTAGRIADRFEVLLRGVLERPDLPLAELSPLSEAERRQISERKRAPAPAGAEPGQAEPRDPVEELLAEIWADVLGLERVGASESFFALGGHSLLATRVVSRVREAFGVGLPLRALFEEPTVARLARRLRRERAEEAPPLAPQPRPAAGAPLSFAQQRLWFLWQLAPDSAFYNMPAAIRLAGTIDPGRLAHAFGEIVRRHESLRTHFPAAGGRPVQAIDPPLPVPLPVVDLSALENEEEIERIIHEEIRRPFNLARGPVLRTLLLLLGPESALLVVNLHHVVSDAWSVGVLYREFAEVYRGAPLPELPVQYADFAIWQRSWLQGETLDRELSWWRERLAGLPPTDLPADRPRPAVQSFRGATLAAEIPPEVAGELRALSRRVGATLFMTLLAGFKALVHRYTGREDVIVGTPVANRERIELERLVGFFVNTLALRTDLSGRPGFRAVVERVREAALEAWAHQALPFEKVVEELAPERDAGRQPIFQQMFQLVEVPPSGVDVGGLVLERLEVDAGTTTFDLALDLHESPDGGVAVRAVYSTDLYDAETIRRLTGHLARLLAGAAEDPDAAIAALPILSPEEIEQALVGWNGRVEAPPGFPLTHEAFEARARLAPAAIALVCEGERLTYGELNLQANHMAHRLLSLGAGPEVVVGVLLKRSPRLVAALLAVLKAGAVYLPLDPALPRERLDSMLADAGAVIVIAEDWEEAAGRKKNPRVRVPGEALAYVIYTSGSTGRPKGVGVSHQVLAAHVRAIHEELALDSRDTVLQFAAASFDVALEQLLPPLAAGARVVLRPEEVWTLPELLRRLDEEGVTVADLPAAYWSQLAHEAARGALPPPPPRLRLVLAGGEALRAEAVQRWRRGPFAGVRLLNAYGPTETAVTATVADLTVPGPEGEERVPIGQAVAGRALYVLDPEGALAPAGVPGELFVGGPLLARGYLDRADQTAERFVPDPFGDEGGGRLYRTGDLVRRLADGRLEFVGRADRQLKVRGFRIEPGEVEAALLRHPAVREAVVVAREDDGRDRRLVAYVACDPALAAAEAGELDDWEDEQVEQWRAVYDDDVYGELPDPAFNISGWNSSYTRGPIPAGEMREWLDATVDRIFSLLPPAGSRVLEIGSGTGLVLFRVAPRCARYVGADFSAVALEHTRSVLEGMGGNLPVELRQGLADDPAVLGDETYDAVFLNSVVQYFPSLDYLLRVLEAAVARVEPGGFVFVGDVRSLPLLPAFHASVELHRAPAGTSRERLARRVEAKIAGDPELVIDPAFFAALRKRLPRISHVEVQLRRGYHRNELNRFRYDAVLHIGRPEVVEEPAWLDWEAQGLSLPELRRLLEREAPARIAVRRVPNDRVRGDVAAIALLRDPDGPRTAGELRQASATGVGIDPEDIWEAARGLPYEVGVTWSREPGRFDAVLRRREGGARTPLPGLCPPEGAARLASDPLGRRLARRLAPRLKAFAAERLPAPMVPADVVVLDEMPLNARGKVDLRALPAPERVAPEMEAGFVPPRTPEERAVADVWAELLGLDQVGAGDDFFALGGHSLLATQVLSRVRQGLGVELELRHLFEEPTVAGLAARVREAAARGGEGEGEPPLVPVPRTAPPPLSFGQRRLWFLHRLDPRSAAYNMAGAWRLAGLLDVPALAAGLGEIVRRHEVLRTTYAAKGEEPVQVVHPPAPFVPLVADLSGLSSKARDAEARRLVAEEAARPFDLSRGPVLRATLVRLGRREHLALVTVHHIACDGWSIGVLIRELGALYAAAVAGRPSPLPDPPLQYGDFAAWQRRWLDGPALAARIDWWKGRLAGAPPALELPSDRPRPAARSQAGGLHPVAVSAATAARLAGLARTEGTTLFAVLLAAFQALLGRLTGEDDLVVGTPVAGRRQIETEELIGFFVNTLALRAGLAGDPAFRAHLGKTQEAALDAFAHQDLPFERLVEELRPERSLSHAPVFQVLFALQNAPGGPLELPGLTMAPLPPEPRALFDLELSLAESEGGLSGAFGFALDLFEPATAGRIARHFLTLIEGIGERPEARLSELPLLSTAEIGEILEASRGPVLEISEGTVLDLFAAQAARTPDAEAVAGMTYGELDLRSGRLARRLVSQRGGIVGLRAERSAEFVVNLFGVMRAGAAWLPLDPSLPEERAAFLLADSGARLLPELPDGEDGPMPLSPGPGDLAYVIYTSGTTGRPKGVMVEHGSLLHTLRALLAAFPFGPGERMVSIAPFSFDIFLFEVLGPLLTGGSVSLPPIRPSLDIDRLLVELETATRFHAVPAVLRQVVDRGGRAGLREIYTGGDLVPPELIADARRAFPDARVAVLYGPTEGTIVCAAHPAPEAAPVRPPLGHPLPGVALELRDRFGNLVPEGVPGEIHIGGPGVARGYLGRPELTAERFLPAPGGARVYRTGDLARRRADGALEFLGRADDQVKVRGFRIEPGEIEARLAEHPGVGQAAVVVRSDGGEKRLAAFFVPSGEAPSPAELRAHLLRTLPDYMVPAVFAPLAELPLTPNAKVDRRALAARPLAWTGGETEAPRTPEEEIVTGLWAELLGVERIGPRDDVFERGAHSLLVTRAVSRLREAFGVELPLRTLFEEPTPAGQARRIAEARTTSAPPIRPVPREGELPLSFAQQRLWFLEQMEPGNPLYGMPAVLRLRGQLDAGALARALTGVVRRHEALRTVFPARRGRPRQEILPPAPFPLPVVDLATLPPERREREAWSLGQAETRRPFDLAAGPLLRGVLLRLDPAEHVMALNAHHIVTDGWSTAILVREVGALYGDPSPLLPLPVQYADFAVWQRERLAGDVLEAQLAWWRRRLQGAPPALELSADRPRPPVRGLRGAEEPVHLPRELADGLVRLGRREGATLFMTLLAGFQALLHRYSGQDDVSVGAPIAGRGRIETEGLIGFFVNTLVMRADLGGDPSFRRLLARVREGALDAWAHQDLPFEKLVEELDPVRDPARTPLFQAVFALQDRAPEAAGLPGLEMIPVSTPSETAKFDLTLSLADGPAGLTGAIEYSTDLFDPATVRRLMAAFERLLRGAVADPDLGLAALPLLDDAGRHQVAVEWAADTRAAYPRERAVHELFAERAALAPDLPALSHGGERLTYADLDARADRLARRLRAAGVGPEEPVAVLLERSAGLIVALLAVLKAGGAYVPLDPSYPPERLAWMLDDCGARVLVAEGLPAGLESGVRVLRPGEDGPEAELPPSADPEGLAYILYTSGSTGRPKGVEVPHRAVVRLVRGSDFAPLGPGDRVAQGSNAAFDAATFEIWGALLNGAELVVAPPRASLEELGSFLERERITALWLTASLFHQMVDGPYAMLASVRQLLTGGEVVSAAHVRRLLSELPGRRVVNGYGPTENTTFTCCHRIEDAARARSPLPIGRPIANTRVYLLDAERRPVPPGVAGELCAGGDGLARGYLRRPGLTAERFVPDPFGEPGSRLYRTGDLARWLPDGTVEFLGRLDDQVKLRGFRIEPGEIEAAAAAHPAVLTAVVLPRPDGAGGKRLVGYLVPSAGAARDTAVVRTYLRGRLPDYMVPAAFVWLEALPVNENGKVDRRALERIEAGPEGREVTAPRTPIEEGLAGIWRDVLGVEAVGPEDDFFDLGGHSLLATQVASRVREAFGVELPLRDLFAAPRLDALAARIEEERRLGAGLASPPVTPLPRGGGLPLSFAQEWMWVVDQLSPSSEAYNAPIPVRLRGALDTAALEAALREVARRHEILRTRFVAGPLQWPDPALTPPLALADLAGLPAALREPEAALQAAAEAARPFDLAAGPPARALLLRLDAADHLLILNLHHIVTDGWSAGVLLRELAALYDAARAGSPSPLPAPPVQYGDFAVWQRRWLSGEALETLLGYWRGRLAVPLPVLELPVDRPGAAPGLGERLPFQLGPGRTAALREIARGRGTTLFVVLLAAFQTLLSRYSRQEDLVVGTPVANRTRRELEDLIGYFVNNLALRTDLGGDPGFPELLDRVHETTLGAWSHQDLPILKLIQELHPERAAGGAMPLFRVWFQLQNTPLPRLEVPGLTLLPYELESRAATFDLELLTLETDDGIAGHFVYSRELFLRGTAEAMLRNLLVLIEGIVADPDRRLSDLPLLAPEERQALLHDWNPSAVCPGATPLHRAFEAVAAARPEAPAATFEGQTLTYGQLDRRANALAHRLRALGVGPESRVGLAAERSLELVIGILGILKAGGAYVPLDPDYPQERLSLLLADARVQALVSVPPSVPPSVPVLLLDAAEAPLPPETATHPDHLAYVIYTSGSTGRPKGVMVTHRQAARLFEATRSFGFGPDDVWTLFHSYAFDFSVWELWGALLHGGRLAIVPRWVSRSPEAFLDLLAGEGVTVLNQTPSAFYQLMRADAGQPLRLRWVIFGGEALEPSKLRPWFDRRGDERPVLVNMYGITETTVHVTLRPLTREDSTSVIGRALEDLRLYLLDASLSLAPAGAVGEICVGGGGVARGYLGRPELTAERFVPDPFAAEPGARLYRSGDLARWRPGGELEYLGRADQQLKVRGFRIEPGEIEAALVRHPAVAQAAVVARRLSSEDVRLAVCVVARDGAELPPAGELWEHLLGLLPEPWVPGVFVPVPALPLTPHGKVDRRALYELVAAHTAVVEESGAAPASPLEELLAEVWAGLLEVDRVGRDESFFALGGHSLLMTRVASRVREALGVAPPMRSFFDRPTVANLAAGLLGELASRLEPGRLDALAARVRDLSDAEVAALVEEKRAALLARVVPSTPAAPQPVAQPIAVAAPIPRALPGSGLLERLAARGDARVHEVLTAMADAPAEDEPLRVETIAFPTFNRPEVLERGIASYAEAAREHGRTLRFAVLDDSRDPAVRDEYRQRLAGLRRRFGAEILYAGLEEKRRFREDLVAAGVPPEAVAMALTDPEGVGVPVGANRNSVLLQTIGEGALSVDDDTVGLGGPPPESLPGVAFLSGTTPGTAFLSGRDPGAIHGFGSRAEAVAAVGPGLLDLAGVHEALLGREMRPWLTGLDPEAPAALDGGDPGFLCDLERGGRVLVTTNGWAGDCGWRSPTFYMLLTGGSWQRLARSPEAWRAATASKEIVRFVPRPTVGNGDSFMATLFTGLDNRRLLPPFPPVLWGEDLLFGITLQLGIAGSRVGHLPGVAVHDPLEHRAFWPGEMVRSASGVDHSRLVAALLDGFAPDPDACPEKGLRRLGAFLMECGRMEPGGFDELARQRVGARAEAFAAELETRLAAWGHGDAWTADVRRYLDLLRKHMAEPDFAVPLDLLYGRDPEEARRLAQRLILNHGVTLAHWPNLVEAARGLKARGRGLAEAIP